MERMERMEGDAQTLLSALRAGGEHLRQAQDRLAFDTALSTQEQARRADLRGRLVALLAADIRPTDRPLARWLLTQETAAQHAQGASQDASDAGASEALYTLVALVARFAQPEDALLIWRARQATQQTQAGVDVEQLARAGVERVRAWLTRLIQPGDPASQAVKQEAQEARAALAWLDEGATLGAFDDLPGYFAWADERFGLATNGPT